MSDVVTRMDRFLDALFEPRWNALDFVLLLILILVIRMVMWAWPV